MLPLKISCLNLTDSTRLVKFMISPSKRKSILRISTLETSLRNSSSSINLRNTMLLLIISPKITQTNMYRKIQRKKPQLRKIQEEVAMDQEEGIATIMRATIDIPLRMNKTREDYTSLDRNAQLDKRKVIKVMVKLTLRRIKEPQQRMHSTKMKFITRVLQAALLVHMTEEPEEGLEVPNPTMMMLVIQASEVEADATTKRMKKIITRVVKEENPRKIIVIHGVNLKKIPKKRPRWAPKKVIRPKRRRKTIMTTRREETMVTKNLIGRERVETSSIDLASPKKRTMLKDSLLKNLRLSRKQRRETWQRLKQESMIRLLRKRETFNKLRDQTRSSSKSTTK